MSHPFLSAWLILVRNTEYSVLRIPVIWDLGEESLGERIQIFPFGQGSMILVICGFLTPFWVAFRGVILKGISQISSPFHRLTAESGGKRSNFKILDV